jgi:hypothetical protein
MNNKLCVSADTVHCRKLICDEIITPPILNSSDGVQSFYFTAEEMEEGINQLYSLQILQKGNYIFSFSVELGGNTATCPFNFTFGLGDHSIEKVLYSQTNIVNFDKLNFAVSYLVVVEDKPINILLVINDVSFEPYITVHGQFCRF